MSPACFVIEFVSGTPRSLTQIVGDLFCKTSKLDILQVAQGGVLTGIIQGQRMYFIVDLLLLQDEVETSLTGLLGPDLSRTRIVMRQSVGACYVVEGRETERRTQSL